MWQQAASMKDCNLPESVRMGTTLKLFLGQDDFTGCNEMRHDYGRLVKTSAVTLFGLKAKETCVEHEEAKILYATTTVL